MENHFLWKLLKLTIKNWRHDKISLYAAALAYYTAFSITPFLVICISVVGLLVGDNAAESEILTHIIH
jgi:membrane protein